MTASAGPDEHTLAPASSTASTMPGPPTTRTRSPGLTSRPAAVAEVMTHPAASIPTDASLASTSANVLSEAFVTNTTAAPDLRSRSTASAEPGTAVFPTQITPSRSRTQPLGAGSGVTTPISDTGKTLAPSGGRNFRHGRSVAQETSQVGRECSKASRSPGPDCSWAKASCLLASPAYSDRSTAR